MENSGFGWVLLGCTIFGIVHSLLATNTLKSIVQRRCTSGVFKAYRLIYNLFAAVCSIGLAALVLLLPDQTLYRIPSPWVFFTLLIQLLAVVCMGVAFLQSHPGEFLGIQSLYTPPISEEKTPLMTAGFYRWTRHPLYFFAFVLMWFFPWMTWNLLALFSGLTLYTILGSLLEERRLVQEFGKEYKRYQKTTPWIIPNPLKLIKK